MNPLLGESPSLRADVIGVSLGPPMFQVTGQVQGSRVAVLEREAEVEPVVEAPPPPPPPVVIVQPPPPPKVFASESKEGTPVSVTVHTAPVTVEVHPTPVHVTVPLEMLTDILKEVTALRDDLARRSFGGRWTRLVAWVQAVWRRLT